MRNCAIGCLAFFVLTGTAYSETKTPPKELAVDLGGGVKLEMALIPAGSFTMGDENNGPVHQVNITKPFYLGKYEVTQREWQAVMGGNPSNFKEPKSPVEQVSWDDCQAFLGKLNAKAGGQGGRFELPTEAQWEYACRAGSEKKFSFGDDENQLDGFAWYGKSSGGKTHTVGEKKPNAWGLYDMPGNVSELCADWYVGYYAKTPTDDPAGPATGLYRVARGGSWGDAPGGCGSAYRHGYNAPWERSSKVGLRVCRVLTEGVAETRLPERAAAIKLQAIPAQTVKPGKRLALAVSAEDARPWQWKLRYSLDAQAPRGASIDQETGAFTWTPGEDLAPGKYDVSVSVAAMDGRTDRTSFSVTVTRPMAAKEIFVDLGAGIKLGLVLIPDGSFLMGDENNGPVHRVNITKPFQLGEYEVTQEQWQAVMGTNPSKFKGPKHPVENVSWDDCQAFLGRLNAKTDGQGGKFELPTEAQWEYACRAGSAKTFHMGDDEGQLGDYAWYDKNSGGRTHPVGEKKPNAWGLYDMYGNVCEWCSDWHEIGYYAKSPEDDPAGPAVGSTTVPSTVPTTAGLYRVLRGGSWLLTARSSRSASRSLGTPGLGDCDLGFRVARTVADK